MEKIIDYTGQKIDNFLVVKRGENTKDNHAQWWCKCDCQINLPKEKQELILLSSKQLKAIDKNKNGYLYCKNCLPNKYDLSREYGIGYTSKGEEFYFDLEDFDKIKNYCWYITKKKHKYVVANTIINDNKTQISLHRLVMNVTDTEIDIDHIKHKEYDNRKSQLRICNAILNERNRVLNKNNTSGVKGVWKNKYNNKWIAEIYVNKEKISLGSFIDKEDAINARKEAEEKYFGEYSYDNSQKLGIN